MVVIDAANVVGSRPDGWWRDRAGAARRLHEHIVAAVASGRLVTPVVLVLEGAARPGVPAGEQDGVRVVHAPAEGDDALVEVVAAAPEAVVLVTADRALRVRAAALGATCVGPTWLLDQLYE